MISAKNAIPLIFLGAISGTLLLFSVFNRWSKRIHATGRVTSRDEEEVDNESGQVQTRIGLRKMPKMPKLWVVQIPKPSACEVERGVDVGKGFYFYDGDLDEDMWKHAGRWNTMKPVSVAYIKNAESPPSLPPSPPPTYSFTPDVDMTSASISRSLGSSPIMPQDADDVESRRSGVYDKAAIEAVQVSILISMPKRPGLPEREATAGPLELGVVNVSLGSERQWKRQLSAQAI